MKKRSRWIGVLLVAVLIGPSIALCKSPSPHGPEDKRFGAGLYLGEPTGLTVKGYLTERFALDGVAAWSFTNDAFTLIGDVTYEFLDIPVDTNTITLPFYAGAGVKIGINSGPGDDTSVGIRVPVGVAVQWVEYPIEVFFELAPGIEMAPATDFDLTGGVGVRFYF